MKSHDFFRLTGRLGLIQLLLLFIFQTAFADSATWNLNPTSNDWHTAANWTPATVPNGPNDIATFGVSKTTAVAVTGSIEINSIVFTGGTSAFTISPNPGTVLTISGAGITNNSGVRQHFVTNGDSPSSSGIDFTGAATAGSGTVLTNNGGPLFGVHGYTYFFDNASAGTAVVVNNSGYYGGQTIFFDNSTAADARIIANGSSPPIWVAASLGSDRLRMPATPHSSRTAAQPMVGLFS